MQEKDPLAVWKRLSLDWGFTALLLAHKWPNQAEIVRIGQTGTNVFTLRENVRFAAASFLATRAGEPIVQQ